MNTKTMVVALLSAALAASAFSLAFAAGDVLKGKALFNDPKAFGAPGEKSCSSCHPDGSGLEKAGAAGRKEWTNPGGTWLSLEDASNVAIMRATKGKPIDPNSGDMQDLVAYIRSLAKNKK